MNDQTVYIVDDDAAVRDSLEYLVKSAGMRVETFISAEDILARWGPEFTGCLVVDVRMPGLNGLEMLEQLFARGCELPAIVITGYGEIQGAVKAFKQGAIDYLQKPVNHDVLLGKIRDGLATDARHRAARGAEAETRRRIASLTRRQQQVMRLVLAGHSNKEIAHQLAISTKTVESHRGQVMGKLEVRNIADLTRLVLSVS